MALSILLWALFNAVPTCASEDDLNCAWNAAEQGNGYGRSFIIVGTEDHYAQFFIN